MATKTYYRITAEGMEYVTENSLEVNISDEVMQRYSVEKAMRIGRLFDPGLIGNGVLSVALCCRGKAAVFTLRLYEVPIQTKFLLKDGLMVPDFAAQTAGSTDLSLKWVVPDNMKVYLMVSVNPEALQAGDSWLLAYDSSSRSYRLPTSNTYEDGKLCQGKYDSYGSSIVDCLIRAYAQFLKSKWQSDLSDRGGSAGMENAMQLFRFKPLEPDGFQSVVSDKTWTALATRVSSEFVNNHITLL